MATSEELCVEGLIAKDGHFQVSTTPGLGVRLADEVIMRYR
jgi:L-alanine-DL-glutamate epimerase-like enolase superfamily enzyme